jgi:predicted amidohydrolase
VKRSENRIIKACFTFTICSALFNVAFLGRAAGGAGADEPGSTPRYVRIGHYQCICKQGDFQANLNKLIQGLELASEARLDVVSLPESFLTGYFRNEEEARVNSFSIDSPQIREVLSRTAHFHLAFMVGFNEIRGGDLYNTVAVIEKGKILGRYSKAFPIIRYFKPGREFPVFEKKGLKFGVIICADGGYIEPARILALKGAKLIFAPHYNFVSDPIQHYQMVRNDHVARAIENGVYFLRANNVVPGRTLEGLGDRGYGYGDSYLLNPNGEIVAAAGLYQEYLMLDLRSARNRPDSDVAELDWRIVVLQSNMAVFASHAGALF